MITNTLSDQTANMNSTLTSTFPNSRPISRLHPTPQEISTLQSIQDNTDFHTPSTTSTNESLTSQTILAQPSSSTTIILPRSTQPSQMTDTPLPSGILDIIASAPRSLPKGSQKNKVHDRDCEHCRFIDDDTAILERYGIIRERPRLSHPKCYYDFAQSDHGVAAIERQKERVSKDIESDGNWFSHRNFCGGYPTRGSIKYCTQDQKWYFDTICIKHCALGSKHRCQPYHDGNDPLDPPGDTSPGDSRGPRMDRHDPASVSVSVSASGQGQTKGSTDISSMLNPKIVNLIQFNEGRVATGKSPIIPQPRQIDSLGPSSIHISRRPVNNNINQTIPAKPVISRPSMTIPTKRKTIDDKADFDYKSAYSKLGVQRDELSKMNKRLTEKLGKVQSEQKALKEDQEKMEERHKEVIKDLREENKVLMKQKDEGTTREERLKVELKMLKGQNDGLTRKCNEMKDENDRLLQELKGKESKIQSR
ncbi:hypothetical protein I302_102283 [Kwoniella bestiolae CBS 10118]|uniref:Uncharacterized protein n=1 Tax=Kwoniella bestiolae CBS 10118 TaxID=1296100 RepID=A0A1B9GEM7_9TREE|nr:hypothetical protein I302_00975 [Kwoniella bestiolae CBS 10118]OCF29470.1 hypothetical protein I302_00975 [Kwoniella bestiolae CBS 10118]